MHNYNSYNAIDFFSMKKEGIYHWCIYYSMLFNWTRWRFVNIYIFMYKCFWVHLVIRYIMIRFRTHVKLNLWIYMFMYRFFCDIFIDSTWYQSVHLQLYLWIYVFIYKCFGYIVLGYIMIRVSTHKTEEKKYNVGRNSSKMRRTEQFQNQIQKS